MPTDKPRITITMDPELLSRVEAHRHEYGFSTKSRAIRSLLNSALSDFSCPAPPAPSLTPDESAHLTQYRRLDPRDQGYIDGEIAQLLRAEKYTPKKASSQ